MNIETSTLIIALSPILATLLVWGIAALCLRNYIKRRTSEAMHAADCPRVPGQSICKTIAGYDIRCRIHTIYLIGLPLVLCAAYGATRLIGSPARNIWWETILIALSVVVLVLICLLNLVQNLRLRRQMQRAYEGKQLAARALEPLMEQGYFIFHDLILEQIHIDHLIVGPKGVFCVQTQSPPDTARESHHAAATVTYNGRALFYPKGEEYISIEKANLHAEWLSGWLSQFLEEPIAARAILAMPGWVVKRTSADGIPVVNPSQFDSLFKHINARPLPEPSIRVLVSKIQAAPSPSGNEQEAETAG